MLLDLENRHEPFHLKSRQSVNDEKPKEKRCVYAADSRFYKWLSVFEKNVPFYRRLFVVYRQSVFKWNGSLRNCEFWGIVFGNFGNFGKMIGLKTASKMNFHSCWTPFFCHFETVFSNFWWFLFHETKMNLKDHTVLHIQTDEREE